MGDITQNRAATPHDEGPENTPSMLLQLALQRVDFIVNTDLIDVSDEVARRKKNPYAKRKINMGDAKHYAKWAADHLRGAWDGLEWVEKGLEEWRTEALAAQAEARRLSAPSWLCSVALGERFKGKHLYQSLWFMEQFALSSTRFI
jgi:hypothetical protein